MSMTISFALEYTNVRKFICFVGFIYVIKNVYIYIFGKYQTKLQILYVSQIICKCAKIIFARKLRNPYFHHICKIGRQHSFPKQCTHWLGPGLKLGLNKIELN